ncbi:pectate lyase family protein [Phytoactinopolyspora mesophila]|uniref:Pectate lyase n=1 Tax=Phytoactinopolyspora mesophila TaxID=2650750 RepID=A0A7K3M246_9ACTN|nr:polysaccharide lyase family 1 protein [Phytoactinopolyspora mesophila]NDL57349.1 pectate lyase [Phytoactinopolyspora mesophila]
MRRSRSGGVALAAGVVLVASAAVAYGGDGSGGVSNLAMRHAREALPEGDGWGSAGAGTTGGSNASEGDVHVVSSRAELIDALGGDNDSNQDNATPKIVFVDGVIDGFESPDGGLLTCADFADPDYDFDEYLATYAPDVWGWDTDPQGPLEDARERSMRNQEAHTQINVGSNTTLIGLPGATLRHLTLMFNRADNVIIRNITFDEAFDCQPRWRPTDGAEGNWNSHFDHVSVRRGSNFWIDNNTFLTSPEKLPEYFGRKYEIYDGQLDITHTADLVTVSNNIFKDHDKLMLIGSTNNPGGGDPGRLNVTLRHNVFDGIGQRAPRVRFGQVDIYNNYYKLAVAAQSHDFDYAWGAGVESQIYAESNYFTFEGADADASEVIYDWGGTAITEKGTWADLGRGKARPVSLLDEFNAINTPGLGDDAGWTPVLRRGPVLPAIAVPAVVSKSAGAGGFPL